MGVTLANLLSLANNNLNDDSTHLSTSDREELCRKAVRIYSRRRPFLYLQAYIGTTSSFHDLPTHWDGKFSYIENIEYPIEQTPPSYIKQKDFDIDLMDGGKKIRFSANRPPDGETFWVRYTGLYFFDSNNNSQVPEADDKGISYLAAALMCQVLASFYSSRANPNYPNVELMNYDERATNYSNRAKEFYKLYDTEIPDETGVHGSVDFITNSYWDRTNA